MIESHPGEGTPLSEVRQKFLDELRRQVVLNSKSPATLRTYEVVLDSFQRGAGAEALEEIDQALVGRYLVAMREGTLAQSRKPNSQATVAKNWRHLNGFFQWCRRRGYAMPRDLFEEGRRGAMILTIPQPIIDEQEPKAWSPGEVESIRVAARTMGHNSAERALTMLVVELLLRTGMRLSELANVVLDDIQGDAIRIGKSKSVRQRRTRTTRWVPLYPEPRRMVAIWLERYRRDASTEHLLISPQTGKALTWRGIQSLVYRAHDNAVVQGGPHRYRHT